MDTIKKTKRLPGFLAFALLAACAFLLVPSYKIHSPKVYDCFLFYNELELLEIRLHEMNDYVDKFVIVEATETFRGNPKKLFYEENKALFEKYKDKIIHITISDHVATNDPWVREHYQRNQVLRGLKDARPHDIVLLSDVDEIVRKTKIPELVRPILTEKCDLVVCQQTMYQGHLNRRKIDGIPWPGTTAVSYKMLKKLSPTKVRKLRKTRERQLRRANIQHVMMLSDAGWHFTSMGGIQRYLTKIESFSHSEMDSPEIKTEENLSRILMNFPIVSIDESFPSFVRENQDYLREKGFLDKE